MFLVFVGIFLVDNDSLWGRRLRASVIWWVRTVRRWKMGGAMIKILLRIWILLMIRLQCIICWYRGESGSLLGIGSARWPRKPLDIR